MSKSSLLVLLLLIPTICLTQVIWFSDNFKESSLRPQWDIADSSWHVQGGALRVEAKSYDQLLSSHFYAYATQRFSFEVTLRGIRAGVFFSLDGTRSKTLSHMVRFDEKSVLAGYFDGGGEFTATGVYDVPKMPTEWTTLRVDVDPVAKFYAVYVDDLFLGADTNLVFSSGYIGLQASDGLCEFKSVKVCSHSPPLPPRLPQLGSELSFLHVGYVHSKNDDLELYVPELGRVVRIDADGHWLSAQRPKANPTLTTKVTWEKKTFSIAGRHIVVRNLAGAVIDSINEHLVAPSDLLVFRNALCVADPGAKAVFQLSSQGRLVGRIDASIIGGFKAPRGITMLRDSQLVIADYDRLVFWDENASHPPVITFGPDGRNGQIQWKSNSHLPGWVEYSFDDQRWDRIESSQRSAKSAKRAATLEHLKPLTRYSLRYSPAFRTIPQSASTSKLLRFSTPPANKTMMPISRLPVLCMVYRTISYRDKYPRQLYPKLPDGRTLSDDDIAYLKRAIEFNREFYFRNSGCRMVLDFDFFVIEDTLWLHEVGDSNPYWLSPNDRVTRDFEQAARSLGKRPEYFAGLICPYAWNNYPPRRPGLVVGNVLKDSVTIRQAVGGGTYGVPAPWKYGKTAGYTSNPFQDRSSRQDWLITHEFHHQIDALMDVSGYPEYYHADQPWKMPGRFGEDFDFNAQIMRLAPPSSWLTLRFGTLSETLDADHDGVPDDDPSLPFDEKRLGSNPASMDSDNDGVADLAEVMMGTSRGSDLNNKDTDGDGLEDGVDPEPLYPISPQITKLNSAHEMSNHPFGTIASSTLSAKFYVAWTDSAFYVSALTDKPANLLLQIDANNDGWFHGFDNIQIRVIGNADSVYVADYYLRDCSSWVDPPKDRRDILRNVDLGVVRIAAVSPTEDALLRYRLTIRVPKSDHYGFALVPGKRFGIRLGVQATTDLWVWDELFERNYMMPVELR